MCDCLFYSLCGIISTLNRFILSIKRGIQLVNVAAKQILMKFKQITAVLAFGVGTALIVNTAQAQVVTPNPNQTGTPQTEPPRQQQAGQDSLRQGQRPVSAQDKTEIRDQQIRSSNPEATQPNAQKQQPATGTRTQTQGRTTTTTTPNGTTVEQNRTRTQTQTQPGQQPNQTRTQSRTITHPDGRVMTHDYEYYNNNIVVRDTTGRRYYIENERWIEVTDTTGIERRMTPEQQRMMKDGQQNNNMRPDNNSGQNKGQGSQGTQGQDRNQNQTPRTTTTPQSRP